MVNEVIKFFEQYPGHMKTGKKKLADRIGCSMADIDKAKEIIRNEEQPAYNQLDDFAKQQGFDLNKAKYIWYKGEGLSVAVKPENESFNVADSLKEAVLEYKAKPSVYLPIPRQPQFTVVSLFDCHIDKISLLDETDEESSIDKNIKTIEKVFDELIENIKNDNPERIIFPIGNDFWQTNDANLTTKKGTDLKDSIRTDPKDAFKEGYKLLRRCIDKLRKIAPVKVIPIKGNHDEDRIWNLTQILDITYENCSNTEIVNSRKQRLYHFEGSVLCGFAHGDKERKADKLPMLMATDKASKEVWSKTKLAIFFLGDIHHEQKYKYMQSKDFQGCEVKFLRSMSGTDKWHWENGFTGVPKTAYAFTIQNDGNRVKEYKINI